MKKIVLKESFGDNSSWKFVNGKLVSDEDGFLTDYTWYKNSEGKHIFMFGDSEIYTPDEDYADYVTDSEEDAQRWFDSYNGLVESNENAVLESSKVATEGKHTIEDVVNKYEGCFYDEENGFIDCSSSDTLHKVSKELGISDENIVDSAICHKAYLTEGRWEHSISTKNANALRRAVQNDEYADTVEAIKNVYREIHDKYPDLLDDDDLDSYVEDLDGIITDEDDYDFDEDESFEEYIEGSINYELDNLYDFCDNTNIWIPLIEGYYGRKKPYNGKLYEDLTKGNKSDFVDAIRNTSDLNRISSLVDEIYWYDKKLGGILKGYIRGMSKDETISDLKAKLTSKLEESAPKKKQAVVSYREKNEEDDDMSIEQVIEATNYVGDTDLLYIDEDEDYARAYLWEVSDAIASLRGIKDYHWTLLGDIDGEDVIKVDGKYYVVTARGHIQLVPASDEKVEYIKAEIDTEE